MIIITIDIDTRLMMMVLAVRYKDIKINIARRARRFPPTTGNGTASSAVAARLFFFFGMNLTEIHRIQIGFLFDANSSIFVVLYSSKNCR